MGRTSRVGTAWGGAEAGPTVEAPNPDFDMKPDLGLVYS